MNTYLVIEPHTPEECLAVLDDIKEKDVKLLDRFDWGCMVGEHTGYAKVEAENDRAALEILPGRVREKARAIKLAKFTPKQIEEFHKM